MIRTVLGDIAPDTLGATLMHEHILCDITPPSLRGVPGHDAPITLHSRFDIDYGRQRHTGKFRLRDRDLAITEVADFAASGGRAIVELTIGGLDPDPEGLAAVSRATGVAIVMGCGQYTEEFQPPANHARTVEDFAAEMIAAVAGDAAIRAGIIGEIGCSVPWTPLERRVMTAAVLAQSETGAAITIHPGVDPDQPAEIIAFIRALGGNVARTIIGHVDRTIFDHDRLLRLADTGCVLELDLFGYEHAYWAFAPVDMPNDGQRIGMLRALADAGHGDRMVISQDICRLTRLRAFGGHGYGHILRNVAPLMRERGFTAAQVEQMLVHTPRRLLTMEVPGP